MIAVDTNILLYAHRSDSPWHDPAREALASLGGRSWGLPWPVVHEFVAIATHPRVLAPPSSIDDALLAVTSWLDSDGVTLLGETDGHWDTLQRLLRTGRITGPLVHDARVAAICLDHAVDELWTADRDFSRFPALRTRNPLVTA